MQARRTFTAEFKTQVVLEVLTGTSSMAQVCQKHGVKQQVVSRWRTEFLERASEVFSGNAQQRADQERIAELERMVGRLTMEIEILKKATGLLSSVRRTSER
jgi:transposase